MERTPEQHPISGETQKKYLRSLDRMLQSVVAYFEAQPIGYSEETRRFGDARKWQWDRLPSRPDTYRAMAQLTEHVRQEYRWFDWIDDSPDPTKNRGYFEEIGISAISGMPWGFSFIALSNIQETAAERLTKIPKLKGLTQDLRGLLTEDYVQPDAVPDEVTKVRRQAMRRNFLEQLEQVDLLSCGTHTLSHSPTATLRMRLGGEELWHVTFLRYRMDTGLFEAYVVDLWQDVRDRVLAPRSVSPALKEALNFAPDNAAWYMLHTLDERFESLHPVQVSRLLIGPCENRYRTKPDDIPHLPLTDTLLAEDPDCNILRLSRQYTYAPNHYETGEGKLRQELHHDNWSDEFIVCPAKFSARVAQSVEGTHVKVLEVSQ